MAILRARIGNHEDKGHAGGKPVRGAWWAIFSLALWGLLAALLCSCASTPVPVPRNISGDGGFWEQDENTDPRFIRSGEAENTAIGLLRPAGDNVFVNGARVHENSPLPNHAHVGTGERSAARIEFEDGGEGRCRMDIVEMRIGRGYGNTGHCRFHIGTTEGNGQNTLSPTIFHAAASGRTTTITVIEGQMEVWLHRFPNNRTILGDRQEAILTQDRIISVQLTPDEIRERIHWRDRYDFFEDPAGGNFAKGAAAAAAAVGLGILVKEALDDKDDSAPPPQSPSPSGVGTGGTPPSGGPSRTRISPQSVRVTVPELKNKRLDVAVEELHKLGLTTASITLRGTRHQVPEQSRDYAVFSQSPAPFARVGQGTGVSLVVQAIVY